MINVTRSGSGERGEIARRLLNDVTTFDPAYYCDRYVGRRLTPEAAVEHYLTYGQLDVRNPSAAFSTVAYLERYPDVRQRMTIGGVHYVLDGKELEYSSFPIAKDENGVRKIRSTSSEELSHVKIAVVVHAFYGDYNSVLAKLMSAYTFEFDLYITSTSAAIAADLGEKVKASRPRCQIKTAVTANRGRNFGPFLSVFGKDLLSYDVIGHVHSKKSLYTGVPRYDWGLHSISGVLGSPEYTMDVIHELAFGDQFGIACAKRNRDLPYWACHWLKNFDIAAKIAPELNLKIERGFLDYPVGGMFWARGDVLAPFFGKGWELDEFPQESGQIDGTLQHALERLLGVSCKQVGRGILEWDVSKGSFAPMRNQGVEEFKKIGLAEVKARIASAEVVSFDIFDTLLYRDVLDPDDVREQVEEIFSNYREVRRLAEARARAALKPGVDVDMKAIASELYRDTPDALRLLDLEFDYDLASMHARQPVVELVRYAQSLGKRVIFVSDMYYGERELGLVLKKLGIPLPQKIYVSSSVGLRKDAGTMWRFVRESEQGSIVHLGDNMVSDVQNASDAGVQGIYVPTMLEKTIMLGVLKRRPVRKERDAVLPFIEMFGAHPFFC